MNEIDKKIYICNLVSALEKFAKEKDVKSVTMSEIAALYINKAIHIYGRIPELQGLEKDKADNFETFAKFRAYIERNPYSGVFKNISSDICKIIDNGVFIGEIYSNFKQVQIVKDLISQVKTKIEETKRIFPNVQVAEFEKLIEDCFDNMTFGTIDNYKTELENANKRLLKFVNQLKTINDFAIQVKTKIEEAKCTFPNVQVAEFEKLIEDCFNNMAFGTISDYKTKLEDANKQLQEFIDQLKTLKVFRNQVEKNICTAKQLFTNIQVAEFGKLTKDSFNNVSFGTIGDYQIELENANKQLEKFIDQLRILRDLTTQVKTKIEETKCTLPNVQVAEFEKLIEDCYNVSFDTISNYQTKLENANKQLDRLCENLYAERQKLEDFRTEVRKLKSRHELGMINIDTSENYKKTKIQKRIGIVISVFCLAWFCLGTVLITDDLFHFFDFFPFVLLGAIVIGLCYCFYFYELKRRSELIRKIQTSFYKNEEYRLTKTEISEQRSENYVKYSKETNQIYKNERRNKKIAKVVIIVLSLGYFLSLLIYFSAYQGWFAFVFNRSITIPESVTEIRDSEFASKQLTSVVIHDGVTSIGNSAFSRNGLTNVVIPVGVSFVGENAFKGNKLNSITIGTNVTLGSNAFGYGFEDFYRDNGRVAGTYKLCEVCIGNLQSIQHNGTLCKGWHIWHGNFRFRNKNGSITITGYNGTDNVLEIPAEISGYPVRAIIERAFESKELTNVSIPNSVTTIGERAFAFNKLTQVTIPNSVISIGEDAFNDNRLTNINIPNSVTTVGGRAFSHNQLTNVSIPNSVTSIGSGAFAWNKLTQVTIPNSVTSIEGGVFSNNKLTNVNIPNSVTSIGGSAFADNQITSVTIGANVKLYEGVTREHGQGGQQIKIGVFGKDVSFNDVYAQNGSKAGTYTRPNNNSRWMKKEKEKKNETVSRVIIHSFKN